MPSLHTYTVYIYVSLLLGEFFIPLKLEKPNLDFMCSVRSDALTRIE